MLEDGTGLAGLSPRPRARPKRRPLAPRDAVFSLRRQGTLPMRSVEKEAQHFARRVGASGVGIGTARIAAGPCMRGPMHQPVLDDDRTAAVREPCAGESVSLGDRARVALDRRTWRVGGAAVIVRMRPRALTRDLLAVGRVHRCVQLSVEHDRRCSVPPPAIATWSGAWPGSIPRMHRRKC